MEVREITEDRFIESMALDFPNFKISKSNLTHPTSQFVISFYTLILRNCIPELTDPDEIWNVTENQRSYINSYHAEAVSFGQHVWAHNLYETIKYVFDHLSENGSEFAYSDILFPENTPRRSFVFMVLMLNFYWYSNDLVDDLDSGICECMEELRTMKTLKFEKEQLIIKLENLQKQQCEYAGSFKEKKMILLQKSEENNEKEIIMKDLLGKEELVRKELEAAEEEEQSLQESLTKLQNEKMRLESLIVSNENHIKDFYGKHVIKKDECVKKMKNLEEQVKTASKKLLKSNKILELQQKLNQSLKDEILLPDSKVTCKGLQNLYEMTQGLVQKKNQYSEEELSLDKQILEAEEMLANLESQYTLLEADGHDIVAKGKEKVEGCSTSISELRKNHQQTLANMTKYTEEAEELAFSITDLESKCRQKEEEIKSMDVKNKSLYKSYSKEMKEVFDALDSLFGDCNDSLLDVYKEIKSPVKK